MEIWSRNYVNSSSNHYRYDMFHADGKDYKTWDPANNGLDMTKYTMDRWMRNRYLSTSVYPYIDDETQIVNESLTDDSDPAATLYNQNADRIQHMSKPVTNIRMADDGTISFDFKVSTTAIKDITNDQSLKFNAQWYDLNGRRLPSAPSGSGIFILRLSDGTTRKVIQ